MRFQARHVMIDSLTAVAEGRGYCVHGIIANLDAWLVVSQTGSATQPSRLTFFYTLLDVFFQIYKLAAVESQCFEE